jgi:hypothetical protein
MELNADAPKNSNSASFGDEVLLVSNSIILQCSILPCWNCAAIYISSSSPCSRESLHLLASILKGYALRHTMPRLIVSLLDV